jgi:DNA primase
MMFDYSKAKFAVQLLDIVGGLKFVATTGGGEYAGPCPICGGVDRFRVHPTGNTWFCRGCGDQHWHDVTDFIARRDGCTIKEAYQKLMVGSFTKSLVASKSMKNYEQPHYGCRQPDEEWREKAEKIMQICQDNLRSSSGFKALQYLRDGRGLKDSTIDLFQLGYSTGFDFEGLNVPRGIVIPYQVFGKLWSLKIRLPKEEGGRYLWVRGGGGTAIYNVDSLLYQPGGMICEGEFNAMIIAQEAGDCISVCSVGSATNADIDMLAWGKYFANLRYILCCTDQDPEGRKALQKLKSAFGSRAIACDVPSEKYLNDFYLAGGDVFEWLRPILSASSEIDPEDAKFFSSIGAEVHYDKN